MAALGFATDKPVDYHRTMANPDHLAHLQAGRWNEWRSEAPTISPDLIDAELAGADLSGLDLKKAHLNGANLQGAVLNGANEAANAK